MDYSNCGAQSAGALTPDANNSRTCAVRAEPSMREATERLKKISYESLCVAKEIYRKLEGNQNCENNSDIVKGNDTYRYCLDNLGDDSVVLLEILRHINELL